MNATRSYVIAALLIGLMVVLDGCATGNPPVTAPEWSVSPDARQPVRDRKRDGYWWMPKEPSREADENSLWGNRGALFQAWERKKPTEVIKKAKPAPVVERPLPAPPKPGPPITFAEIPETAPVKIEKIVVREHIVLEDVLFDLDEHTLIPEGQTKVGTVAKYLEEYPNDTIIIEGHTCSRGTEGYNLALGMRRAKSVRRYLVELGVEPARVTTLSYGESQPVADNSTEETRKLNRRVVIEIVEAPRK